VAKKLTDNAKQEAEVIKKQMQKTMNEQVIDLAFYTANTLLQKNIDTKDNKAFVEDFIKELTNHESKDD